MKGTKSREQREEEARLLEAKGPRRVVAPVVDFKAFDDDTHEAGTYAAVVAVFGNIDSHGDRIIPGAFVDSLKSPDDGGDGYPPVVWTHDWLTPPIGVSVEAREAPKAELEELAGRKLPRIPEEGGLYKLDRLLVREEEDHAIARQVWAAMKATGGDGLPALRSHSFAYRVKRASWSEVDVNELPPELQWTGGEIRDLESLGIRETGPTLIGANGSTETLGAKAAVAELRSRGLVDDASARKMLAELERGAPELDEAKAAGPTDPVREYLDRRRRELSPIV